MAKIYGNTTATPINPDLFTGQNIPEGGEIFNDYENNKATGRYSHAEGFKTKATANDSHTEGNQTQATGDFSHAEGLLAIAEGEASHAEGINTLAKGKYTHAEGNGCQAIGDMSKAQGCNSVAYGTSSFASGTDCSTSELSDFSFVHGQDAKAGVVDGQQAKWCTALGQGVQTDANHQIALGKYNNLADRSAGQRPAFMVGYGDSNSARRNIFTVFRNGVARIGANPIDNMDVATKQYVDTKIISRSTGVVSKGESQTVIGKYNKELGDEALFIVGNGTSATERSNAFVVYKDGSIEINGVKLNSDSLAALLGGAING